MVLVGDFSLPQSGEQGVNILLVITPVQSLEVVPPEIR
jgi:hypothetical protein